MHRNTKKPEDILKACRQLTRAANNLHGSYHKGEGRVLSNMLDTLANFLEYGPTYKDRLLMCLLETTKQIERTESL